MHLFQFKNQDKIDRLTKELKVAHQIEETCKLDLEELRNELEKAEVRCLKVSQIENLICSEFCQWRLKNSRFAQETATWSIYYTYGMSKSQIFWLNLFGVVNVASSFACCSSFQFGDLFWRGWGLTLLCNFIYFIQKQNQELDEKSLAMETQYLKLCDEVQNLQSKIQMMEKELGASKEQFSQANDEMEMPAEIRNYFSEWTKTILCHQ